MIRSETTDPLAEMAFDHCAWARSVGMKPADVAASVGVDQDHLNRPVTEWFQAMAVIHRVLLDWEASAGRTRGEIAVRRAMIQVVA